MEWISIAMTVLGGIFSGTFCGSIVNAMLKRRAIRNESNFERKLARYHHITTFMELFLYTEESKHSIIADMWDMQTLSIEENQKRAWNVLLTNKRQLLFITIIKKYTQPMANFLRARLQMNSKMFY